MTPCQRCGATNEPTSRFCVACGAPLIVRPAVPGAAVPQTAPPPAPVAPGPGPAQGWGQPPTGFPPNPAARDRSSANSSLGFAETASPPTDADFEAQRAAAQAAAVAMRKGSKPPPPLSSEPPPYGNSSAPPYAPSAPPEAYGSPPPPGSYAMAPAQMTAAMPSLDPEAVPENAPRMLAGFIVSYDTHPLGRSWPVFQGRNRIGRQGSGAELEIELDHPTASSRHAIIFASACPGRIKIEDSGSTNGTLINGARLMPGSRQELKDGDRVRFGLLSAIIKIV